MAVDSRRISAPENTIPYILYTKLNRKSADERIKEAVNQNNVRKDGRKTDEHRKIFLKSGIVSQAKGSAYIEVDKTKVIVSVFDPREIAKKTEYSTTGELNCEFKFAPFSCYKRRLHQQDNEEKKYSTILKRALEPAVCRHEFPNLQVDVYVLVLQNNGSVLSAAITCAGLALAHAGVPMYDTITASCLLMQGDTVLVDPTLEEEALGEIALDKENGAFERHGIIVLSVLSTHEQISELYLTGNLSLSDIQDAMKLLLNTARDIVPLVEKCLVKHVMKNIKEEEES